MEDRRTLDALLQEKAQMREEIMLLQRTQGQLVAAIMTILAGFAGVYWSENVFNDPSIRMNVLILLSQIGVFLLFGWFLLHSNMAFHARHLRSVEGAISDECGPRVILWESSEANRQLWGKTSSFLIALVFMCIMGVGLCLYFVVGALREFGSPVWKVVYTIEGLLALICFVQILRESKPAKSSGERMFGGMGEDPQE
ncbi:hypothetical protein [Haloferula sp. A504]|uniref:hypothetical protein n=1 Tax=Haloferula sp. A504 TaxID=3373601 RepID=UPI0031C71960|nr:hypothetical protein [Verrucomicrobiaceae bacterium E54]